MIYEINHMSELRKFHFMSQISFENIGDADCKMVLVAMSIISNNNFEKSRCRPSATRGVFLKFVPASNYATIACWEVRFRNCRGI